MTCRCHNTKGHSTSGNQPSTAHIHHTLFVWWIWVWMVFIRSGEFTLCRHEGDEHGWLFQKFRQLIRVSSWAEYISRVGRGVFPHIRRVKKVFLKTSAKIIKINIYLVYDCVSKREENTCDDVILWCCQWKVKTGKVCADCSSTLLNG